MFTGIVEQTAVVKGIAKRHDVYELLLQFSKSIEGLKIGDSVAVSGVCLTAVKIDGNNASFDIMNETFKKTSFGNVKVGDIVNAERSLKLDARLEGHFVLGHVDGMRKIKSINKSTRPYIDIELKDEDRKCVVKKGSIAVDGISLTIGDVGDNYVRVFLIPHTIENTSLKSKKKSDLVNIEFDVLGKYAIKKIGDTKKSQVTKEFLKDKGFV